MAYTETAVKRKDGPEVHTEQPKKSKIGKKQTSNENQYRAHAERSLDLFFYWTLLPDAIE